ncbi:MAG: hypothetical protein IIZ61_07760 [Lachnospiraceae bacterium]|nr:hypothetical protein [Lachnospiraceae bacterium]
MSEELTMTVSPICYTKDGEKYAFISFSDGDKLKTLKKTAAGLNVFDAFRKEV